MIENRRLTEEVSRLHKAQTGSRLAEDESFLESVETSFKQFHAFIDMLREAGSAAKDSSPLCFPLSSLCLCTVDLDCNEINGSELKFRYNEGFVIDKVLYYMYF